MPCSFRPLVAAGFQRCRAALPWWQVYGPEGEALPAVTSVGPGALSPVAASADGETEADERQ